MRIGIDIDDTLVSSSESFDKVVKKYKLNFNKKLKDVWTEDERTYIYKNFLKEALRSASTEMPYRGPEYYQAGDYIYKCKVSGRFTWFQGYEEIYYKNEKIYECYFHGGILR